MKLLRILFVVIATILIGATPYQELLHHNGELRIVDLVEDAPNRIVAMTLGRQNPKLNISVVLGGDNAGDLLRDGKAELILTDDLNFPAKNKTPYAIEGAIVIVNLQNPLANISSAELKKIYSGKNSDWHELLQNDYAIHRYLVKPDLLGYAVLQKCLGGKFAEDIYTDSADNLLKLIQGNRHAIGVIGWRTNEKLENVKVLTVDGIAPTPGNIRANKYPLASIRYVAIGRTDNVGVSKYVEMLQSNDFARLVNQNGLLSMSEEDGK